MRGGKYQFVNLKTGQYQVGKGFINFTTEDGLVDGFVPAIHQGPDGVMWFGTDGGGVSRYDGKGFVNFTQKDGLSGNQIFAIHGDLDGVIWFGTGGQSGGDGESAIFILLLTLKEEYNVLAEARICSMLWECERRDHKRL